MATYNRSTLGNSLKMTPTKIAPKIEKSTKPTCVEFPDPPQGTTALSPTHSNLQSTDTSSFYQGIISQSE